MNALLSDGLADVEREAVLADLLRRFRLRDVGDVLPLPEIDVTFNSGIKFGRSNLGGGGMSISIKFNLI